MKDIFDKVKFGEFDIKSRVIRTGIWEREKEGGFLNHSVFERYESIAKSGVGLITSEIFALDYHDRFYEYSTSTNYKGFIKDYKDITNICHKYKVPILGQLAPFYFNDGLNQKVEANDISIEGIRNFQSQVLVTAKKFLFAGFDGIQLNMGNNFYLARFINPYFNQRNDNYGGNTFNRCRIALELINAINKNYDLHISCKINLEDVRKGGMTPKEAIEIAKLFEKYGADSIQLTGRTISVAQTKENPKEYLKDINKLIESVNIPVIVGGNLRDSDTINRLLNENNIEFISMSKPFIAENNFLNKWKENGHGVSICRNCNNCYGKKESRCFQYGQIK
ncbi:oxidoreductase [Methanobrevibacter sp.]